MPDGMPENLPGDPASQGPEAPAREWNQRKIKVVLSYDGTDYFGWQVQPGQPTIQGLLASAIGRLTGENVLPQGSGRTDAGVHALAQVATFATQSPIPVENLTKALNDTLPAAIRVLSAHEVPPEFHARKSAKAKTYEYRVYRGTICSPFLARHVWHYPYPLNEAAMAESADVVAGEHDFTSFAAVDPEKRSDEAATEEAVIDKPRSNVRLIHSSTWQRSGDELVYTVRGSGFLHHMVRNLVGTFVLVGKGTIDRQGLQRILAAGDRSAAGATAPASGLFLMNVEY
jgi:tRNA pseudouridine38-40 synthase